MKPNNQETRTTSSPRHRLRWTPVAILLLATATLVIMMLIGGMSKVYAWYGFQLVLPVLGLIILLATLVYSLIRRRVSMVSLITAIIALLCMAPALMLVSPITYPASIDALQPAATVRLPANVPLKVGWGGDTQDVNYHVIMPDQRWAYDFLVEPYVNGSSELTDYGCYGIPVVAPADGVITSAHDGEPDMLPGVLSNNLDAPAGNFVAIQLETGTYLLIAHLKPGSVSVVVGDTVEEGQVIGECGNSGNTSEPHIHIHHQRQDPNLYPIGFAEGLPLFFRDHDGPPMPQGGFVLEDEEPILTGDLVQYTGN